MSEWDIVLTLVVLGGLVASVARPLLKLNSTITLLNANTQRIHEELQALAAQNKASHARLWSKNDEQDDRLNEQDSRITKIESKI